MGISWLEKLRAWRHAKLAEIDANPYGAPPKRPGLHRGALGAIVGAAWVAWAPWAYIGLWPYVDWTLLLVPVGVGLFAAFLAMMGWVALNSRGWASWVGLGLTVAFMAIAGWDGGYEVGGPFLGVVAASPAVAVGWAVPLLWRHGRADWWEEERLNSD